MPLAPGARLGSYEIRQPIGAGGMGQVYRARDTRLQRDVAVKILPEMLADDPDRLARFEREAQALAALNHPHIAQVYGILEGPPVAIVMELVEGEDLRERISRGPVPLETAVPLARQIADGLEAAHERGVIHRDLKPANIRVRPDGVVKLLDFGLARTPGPDAAASGDASPDPMNSPTFTSPAGTQLGMVLGTAAYMAPEQARGEPVDKRADIWAFGVVLTEMLTGRALFAGGSIVETLAAVIKDDPKLDRLPPGTPARVRHLLARCLERDPMKRLRDIGEARIALDPSSRDLDPDPAADPAPVVARRYPVWAALAFALVLAVGIAALAWLRGAPADPPMRRFALGTPRDAAPFTAAIAPDGSTVAVIAQDRLWLQRLDAYDPIELAGTEGAHAIFWSPDGREVGFQARGQLWRLDVTGGQPILIGRVPQDFTFAGGAAWLDGGRILFTTGGTGLLEIPVSGGEARLALDIDPAQESDLHDATPLPGGRAVMFVAHVLPEIASGWRIDVYTPDDGRRRRVHTGLGPISNPSYAPSGHLLFQQGSDVWALPFSLSTLSATGEPFLLQSNARTPSAGADGTIVMMSGGGVGGDLRLTWIARDGKATPALAQTMASAHVPRLSPDGRFAAATDADGGESDIWIADLERGADRRLTFERGRDANPVWTPDGRTIVYQCDAGGGAPQPTICARRADGSGPRVELLAPPASIPSLSPDGRYLVFQRANDLWIVDTGGSDFAAPLTAEPRPFIAAERNQRSAEISPDGRFAAYESSEAGTWTVYLTRFPSGEGKWQLLRGYAAWPRWSAAGDRLYLADDLQQIVQVDVDLSTAFAGGPVSARVSAGVTPGAGFDVVRDGSRFLVPRSPSDVDRRPSLLIVQNWRPR